MKLMLNIRPTRVTSSNRNQVMNAISGGHMPSVGTHGIYLTPYPGSRRETIRVYNLEKHNKRVERYKVSGKKKMQSRVVKPAHWVGHYYDIPVALLKLAGLKVEQRTRYFDIKTAR